MYALKNIVPEFKIELKSSMYALPNISRAPTDSAEKKSESERGILAAQARILALLQEMEDHLNRITIGPTSAKLEIAAPQKSVLTEYPLELPITDVIINGHPNFIPYALLALKNTWRGIFALRIKAYTHSSVSDIGVAARQFERALVETTPADETLPHINVTFIWKNCEHTEMICSPTMYVPIYGEVNIIRFFGRIGPIGYRYESSPYCDEIDAVLDICYRLLRCKTAKAKASMLHALSKRIQKHKYFGIVCLSIADIGVISTLKRVPTITDKDLTPALLEWRKRVQVSTQL